VVALFILIAAGSAWFARNQKTPTQT